MFHCNSHFLSGFKTLEHPTLKLLFSVLTLGVTMTEDNGITLMDLLFWADRNGISFKVKLEMISSFKGLGKTGMKHARIDINDHFLTLADLHQSFTGGYEAPIP